jgi:hypothetical protein
MGRVHPAAFDGHLYRLAQSLDQNGFCNTGRSRNLWVPLAAKDKKDPRLNVPLSQPGRRGHRVNAAPARLSARFDQSTVSILQCTELLLI